MFVQVLNGKIMDAAVARALEERRVAVVCADARGWPGPTARSDRAMAVYGTLTVGVSSR
jgi:hypothetical protein